MNERIRLLAQQAGMYVDLNGNHWPKAMSAEECEVAYKKFAQLIVLECAERLMQDDFGSVKGVMSIAGARLKEHFGVES